MSINPLASLLFNNLDDENFQLVLFEHEHSFINFDAERLVASLS